MNKLFLFLMMALLVALCVGPTMAGNDYCNVKGDVNFNKSASFLESTFIERCLSLKVDGCIKAHEWAQATVARCDVNTHNDIEEASTSKIDAIYDPNLIVDKVTGKGHHIGWGNDAFNSFTGIAQVNQGAGSANNQGNAVDVAVTDSPRVGNKNHQDTDALSLAEVANGQVNAKNELQSSLSTYEDQIRDSFENLKGIAQVNQSSGSMNNQNNITTISANLNAQGALALTDSCLTMSNICNEADIKGGSYLATIDFFSFGGATGVVQVNQSPGSMNNQVNSIAGVVGFNH